MKIANIMDWISYILEACCHCAHNHQWLLKAVQNLYLVLLFGTGNQNHVGIRAMAQK